MENHQFAGFWVRAAATLIDIVIFLIVLSVPLTLIYGPQYWMGDRAFHGFWDFVINYLLPFIATVWFWQRFLGTPGKMALKLRIVDARTGERPTIGQSVLRYFSYILSIVPLMLGFIWIGVDRRKQGWHDKLARTVVIRDTSPMPVSFERDAA